MKKAGERRLVVSDVYTDAEVAVLLAMMRAGAHSTMNGAIRTAIFRQALHFGIPVPSGAFPAARRRGQT